MIETEISLTSLCYIGEDYDGRIWLYRVADINNAMLHLPFKSSRPDNYYENRDRLYRNDGPATVGTVGVWKWTAVPNRDNPAIDYVQSFFEKDMSPIRIVTTSANSEEDIVDQLKSGLIHSEAFICDTLFCYEAKHGQLIGAFCRSNEFSFKEKKVVLSEKIVFASNILLLNK